MDAVSSARYSTQVPLPLEVLQLVLQHVDLPQRLGPCALVCRAWRAAANAATSSVIIKPCQQPLAEGLSDWLQRHGGQVVQLQLQRGTPDFALPCDQLTKLERLELVCTGTVRPHTSSASTSCSTGSGSPGPQQQPLAALTQLTQLCLAGLEWVGSLQPLSSLTNLRQLHLHCVRCLGGACPIGVASGAVDEAVDAVGHAIPHLVQLTSLSLGNCVSDASLAHISRLQSLKALNIRYSNITPANLAALPQSLTRLVLWYENEDDVLSSITVPALAQLTALQHLQLMGDWELEPAVLSQMTQLTQLHLYDGAFLPAGSAGEAALLAAVARMTLLQDLMLDTCLSDSHVPAAAYAALTASSHLTHLHVAHTEEYPLPAGALGHMFAAERQLASLQDLTLKLHREQQQQQQAVPNVWAVQQQGFDQLLQCCPGLQSLDLSYAAADDGADDVDDAEHQPPIKLDGLLTLSGLTRLDLEGLLDDEGGITTLAQLTWLHDLSICHTGVEYTALLQLTQLKQLEELNLWTGRHISRLDFSCKAPPDVWQQLQVQCVTRCEECARLVLQQKDAQLQEAQAQLAEARQQLAAQQTQHEAQLAAQQAQHEAQLALLQQHLQQQ